MTFFGAEARIHIWNVRLWEMRKSSMAVRFWHFWTSN